MMEQIITRICTRCKIEKSLNEFSIKFESKDGRQKRCRSCRCLASAERAREATKIINSYRQAPCADCKQSYPEYCMEFDHIRGEKIRNVSNMRTYNKEKIIQEIEKCEVICAVCHRIRTNNRRAPSKNKKTLDHRLRVNQFKLKPCTDCYLSFPSVAMDLDHIRGEKLKDISHMIGYLEHKVLEEINKCEVVCANCHRIRTQKRLLLS